MKKHINLQTVMLLLLIFSFACSNDPDPIAPEPEKKVIQVTKRVIESDTRTTQELFSYDASDYLSKYEYTITPKDGVDVRSIGYEFNYDEKKKLKSYRVDFSSSPDTYHLLTVSYDKNKILIKDNLIDKTTSEVQTEFDADTIYLDNNDKVIAIDYVRTLKYTYEYNANGNLAKIKYNQDVITEFLEYDDKNAWLADTGLPQWFWMYYRSSSSDIFNTENNILRAIHNVNTAYPFTLILGYEYNADGYPIKCQRNGDDEMTFEYRTLK